MWDFQCCTSLIPQIGFSHESILPYREWSYEWVSTYCIERFGVVGGLLDMVSRWQFNDLAGQGASHILFTNGGNDMWLHGSYLSDLSDSILAVNMPNGAHHSELYALTDDTDDIKEGQKRVEDILAAWLHDMKKAR
jgi:lysosomal Pro-X carboxypeptidase